MKRTSVFTRVFGVFVLMPAALLFSPPAQGQGFPSNSVISVQVPNELDLSFLGFTDHGNAPGHLDGDEWLSYRSHVVLAPDTNEFAFVLDASASIPTGPGFTYEWAYFTGDDSDGEFVRLAGPSAVPYYTNQPPYLDRHASSDLVVMVRDDAGHFNRLWFGVLVLTPASATADMSDFFINRFDNPRGRARRRLIPLLQQASAQFANGEIEAGKETLRTFQRKMRISRHPLTREQARRFRSLTETIIDTAR